MPSITLYVRSYKTFGHLFVPAAERHKCGQKTFVHIFHYVSYANEEMCALSQFYAPRSILGAESLPFHTQLPNWDIFETALNLFPCILSSDWILVLWGAHIPNVWMCFNFTNRLIVLSSDQCSATFGTAYCFRFAGPFCVADARPRFVLYWVSALSSLSMEFPYKSSTNGSSSNSCSNSSSTLTECYEINM